MSASRKANIAFEDEVRRVAEAVWGLQPGECNAAWYEGDPILHELDGIARMTDVTHLLMVTTSRKLEKVKDDVKKLNRAADKEANRDVGFVTVQKWLVTQDQLEAQHIEHARKYNVRVLILAQFRNRFFDGREYIAKRKRASFGSAEIFTTAASRYLTTNMSSCQ